jgi:hypothetical protein
MKRQSLFSMVILGMDLAANGQIFVTTSLRTGQGHLRVPNFRSTTMKSTLLATAVICAWASFCRAQIIYNGDFETGTLIGWTTFTTPNGALAPGLSLPVVTQFDVLGSGAPSDAAQFQVGEVNLDLTEQGGGIYQTFNVGAGQYVISADFAAYDSDGAFGFLEAGVETVSVDSVTVGTLDFGQIYARQTERGIVQGTLNLSGGTHQITIEFTRPNLNIPAGLGTTPFEYVDNVVVAPVPEPSIIGVGMLGLVTLLFRVFIRKGRLSHEHI